MVTYSHYVCDDGKTFGFIALPDRVLVGAPAETTFGYDRRTGDLIEVIDGRFSGDLGTCVGGPPTRPDQGCNDDATLNGCNVPAVDGGADASSE